MLSYYSSKMEIKYDYFLHCLPFTIIKAINRDSSPHKNLQESAKNWIERLLQFLAFIKS